MDVNSKIKHKLKIKIINVYYFFQEIILQNNIDLDKMSFLKNYFLGFHRLNKYMLLLTKV